MSVYPMFGFQSIKKYDLFYVIYCDCVQINAYMFCADRRREREKKQHERRPNELWLFLFTKKKCFDFFCFWLETAAKLQEKKPCANTNWVDEKSREAAYKIHYTDTSSFFSRFHQMTAKKQLIIFGREREKNTQQTKIWEHDMVPGLKN